MGGRVVRRRWWMSLAGAAALGPIPVGSGAAWGQTMAPAADERDAIVVTGTRIARPDLTVASPVMVIGAQEIALRQADTAEDLLRDLPSVRPSIGPAVNSGGDGSASIDLRGLGTNRTLVLLDGRRIVPFGLDGIVDLDAIPLSVIDRVDVVTGGASSTYGADAVAGVVNFVTKRDLTGLHLSATSRVSDRGDAGGVRGNLTYGTDLGGGRGHLILDAGYQRRSPLLVTDRETGAYPVSSATGGFSGATSAPVTIFASPTNAALGLPASAFGAVVDPSTGQLRAATVADTYNSYEGTYYQTPLDRITGFASGHYALADTVELYATGLFARNRLRMQLAPSATFGSVYQLPLNNPYLPAGIRNQICSADTNLTLAGIQPLLTPAQCAAAAVAQGPGSPGYVEVPVIAQRRFTEYGARGNIVTSTMVQFEGGMRGDIARDLHFDLSAQYGQTRQTVTRENWGSLSKVQQALRAYLPRDASGAVTGAPVCSDGSNGCVPLDLFGPSGSITADQIGFIDLSAQIGRVVRQTVVTGSIDGDLFGLASPFADTPAAFSIGAEYRRLGARSNPDAASQISGEVLGTGARTPPDSGAYHVAEAFAELIAPLVTDVPLIHRLQAEAGVRLSDYSTTGRSLTWKAGGSYEPFAGLTLRGMADLAVRAPNITELYQSAVIGLGSLDTDPCQASRLPTAASNPGLAALCVQTGAPAAQIGAIPAPASRQINQTTSGNPDLGVERARSVTLGAVLTPAALPHFSATIDYFHIVVRDAISNPASGDILDGCYSSALNPGYSYNAFCALVRRNPLTGSLNGGAETGGVILAGSNLGRIQTAGVDVGLAYRLALRDVLPGDPGTLAWSLDGTWLDYYRFQATPNAINRDCTARYSVNCTNPRPRFKWNARWTWSKGPIDLSLLWTHIGAVSLEPYQATATLPLSTPQPGGPNPATVLAAFRHIPAYDYFDLTARVTVARNLQLTFGIDNLADRKPPLVGNGVGGTAFNNGNTFPTVYDVIGRSILVGAAVTFR